MKSVRIGPLWVLFTFSTLFRVPFVCNKDLPARCCGLFTHNNSVSTDRPNSTRSVAILNKVVKIINKVLMEDLKVKRQTIIMISETLVFF